jgi:hypothetical protein
MWLKEIFEREFGFSDVQSNYSRVYAWMANQLGHMTLGMATAFFFIWIVETVFAFVDYALASGGIRSAFVASCADANGTCISAILITLAILAVAGGLVWLSQRFDDNRLLAGGCLLVLAAVAYAAVFGDGCSGCWNMLFLGLAVCVIGAGFVAISCAGIFGAKADVQPGLGARYFALMPFGSRLLHVFVLIIGISALYRLFPDGPAVVGATGNVPNTDPVMVFSLASAFIFVAAACALLVQDTRFIVVGSLSLIGTYLLATDGQGFGPNIGPDVIDSLNVVLPVAFIISSCIFIVWRARAAERFERSEWIGQVCVNVFIAALFTYAVNGVTDDEWRLSIAAGAASLTLWWIKEFASDLPNVHREIHDIGILRPGGVHDGILGDCRAVEADYFADARMDARTDALFYFAGAWVGAGVLTDVPVLGDSTAGGGWASGSEILGLLIFLAVFIGLGRNWAFRQLALDLTGTDKASRLAVFHSALWLKVVDVAKGRFAEPASKSTAEGAVAAPLLVLRDFAGDIGDTAQPESRFHHLIVFGARGSGRTPLGRALASEAALADWPTVFLQGRRRRKTKDASPGQRTARYLTATRLFNYLRDIETERDIVATPTVPMHIHNKTRAASPDKANLPDGPSHVMQPASIVVIDDVSQVLAADSASIATLLQRLSLRSGQQTVWLIEIDEAVFGETWDKTLTTAVNAARPLIEALAGATSPRVADDICRIGTGLARRANRLGMEPAA